MTAWLMIEKKIKAHFLPIDKLILYLFPTLGLVGIILPFLMGQINLSILGSYLAIPMVMAPLIYQRYRRNFCEDIIVSNNNFNYFMMVYILFYLFSLILLYTYAVRPTIYYIMITLIATIILLEIILFELSQKMIYIILFQIAILTLNIIWGVSLNYYYFIGRTDILVHSYYLDSLISNGFITNTLGDYESFSLWYILNAFLYIFIKVPITSQKIMSFICGMIYANMMILIYIVSLKIVENKKIALLASLFTSISSDVIFYGMYSIPRSVELIFEVILLMFLLNSDDTRYKILVAFVTLVIILYHPVSIIFIALILIMIYIINKLYQSNFHKQIVSVHYLIFVFSATLAYWMYNANTIFLAVIYDIISDAPSGILTKSIIFTPLNELFNYLQYTPLVFFFVIGLLYILHGTNNLGKIFCIVGLLLIIPSIPGPSLMINKLSSNFSLDRFAEYSFIFISIASSLGFAVVYYKSKKHIKIFSIILFAIFVLLSISNDFVASDNPLIKRPFYTFYLNESEVIGIGHLANFTSGYLMQDYVGTRYLMYSNSSSKAHLLEVNEHGNIFLRNSSKDVILIRDQELIKRPLKLYTSKSNMFHLNPSWSASLDYYGIDLPLWNTLTKYNKIYESRGILGFN